MIAKFASVVIIPIKSFTGAKERLSSALDATDRHMLARYMASRVVAAAVPFPVIIVCDDDEVADWAQQRGAAVVRQQTPGLNNAAKAGFDAAREAGFDWAIIAHSDLPLATHFDHLVNESMPRIQIGMVSDQHGDGTNVLVIATDNDFGFHYGPGSCRAHCDEAIRRGFEFRITVDIALAIDIDTPDDLVHLPADWMHSAL